MGSSRWSAPSALARRPPGGRRRSRSRGATSRTWPGGAWAKARRNEDDLPGYECRDGGPTGLRLPKQATACEGRIVLRQAQHTSGLRNGKDGEGPGPQGEGNVNGVALWRACPESPCGHHSAPIGQKKSRLLGGNGCFSAAILWLRCEIGAGSPSHRDFADRLWRALLQTATVTGLSGLQCSPRRSPAARELPPEASDDLRQSGRGPSPSRHCGRRGCPC